MRVRFCSSRRDSNSIRLARRSQPVQRSEGTRARQRTTVPYNRDRIARISRRAIGRTRAIHPAVLQYPAVNSSPLAYDPKSSPQLCKRSQSASLAKPASHRMDAISTHLRNQAKACFSSIGATCSRPAIWAPKLLVPSRQAAMSTVANSIHPRRRLLTSIRGTIELTRMVACSTALSRATQVGFHP